LTGQAKGLGHDDGSPVDEADQKPAHDDRCGVHEQSFDGELIDSISFLRRQFPIASRSRTGSRATIAIARRFRFPGRFIDEVASPVERHHKRCTTCRIKKTDAWATTAAARQGAGEASGLSFSTTKVPTNFAPVGPAFAICAVPTGIR
jgi:hypothetical protein